MQPSDLRGILSYITRFRDQTFILSIDSKVVTDENFSNLLIDTTVLRSLNIKIVLVYGIGHQVTTLAEKAGIKSSNVDARGATDRATLDISIQAANQVANDIMSKLSEVNQRAAITNAIVAHPYGIKDGVDLLNTGKVEKVDVDFIIHLLDSSVIAIVPPIGYDRMGQTYRVNSDGVALEVAEALRAGKLMFVTTSNGVKSAGKLAAQFSVNEVETFLKQNKKEVSDDLYWKLEHGMRACRNGVSRVHIIDGTKDDSLLSEIFSNEGIGTMVYANDYEAIRRAQKKDARAILRIIKDSVYLQELLPRGKDELERQYENWYLFEIDRNILGCVMLHVFDDDSTLAEMGSLFVSHAHENQGIGKKLLNFAEMKARDLGVERLLALSTQAVNYLKQKGGYLEGGVDLLPQRRRESYLQSKRNSKILYKDLK
ncbi:MAG: amino-acid N-acetyltransferase [Verrucomicrobiota bacterium]